MLTRRDFIKAGMILGAGALLPSACTVGNGGGDDDNDSPDTVPTTVRKFVDPLPLPSAVTAVEMRGAVKVYEISARKLSRSLHSDFPKTDLWGYNGMYPGPTIEARRDEVIIVRWVNALPDDNEHLLDYAYDTNLHGTSMDEPRVRVVPHLHGGHVPPESDGYPENWITPGQYVEYTYRNNQRATTLWYHDHVIGITRLNVMAGLAGFYLIRDAEEDSLGLPSGIYEVPIVIQDRSFKSDGSLDYTVRNPAEIPTSSDHPGQWVPEFFGDTIVVNGAVWPYLDVEPRKYRLRVLNGSNARFYNLYFGGGLTFHQIGSDGGLLSAPVSLTSLLLAPGERADLVVDFSGVPGSSVVLYNTAPDGPFSGSLDPSDVADPDTTGLIMRFNVALESPTDMSSLPSLLSTITPIAEGSASTTREFLLEENVDESDEPTGLQINRMDFDDDIVDKPALGDTEIWRFINLTGDTHPMHLHLVQFQVLDRTPFNADAYSVALAAYRAGTGPNPVLANYLTGPATARSENEAGWKDTVKANPGEVTRIIATFDDYRGAYPMHCHILEHEDNSMMMRFEVV